MQENTPAQGVEIKELKELKGVEIKIPKKVIKLPHNMWGTYKYLEEIVRPGDLLVTLGALRLNNGNIAVIIKVINMNDDANMDNGKE